MTKFCTNCGHANNHEDQRCVECGSPLPPEQPAALPEKPKQPISFKSKLVTVISVVLIASLVGIYSWGTKTASAETAVSKFLAAMQEKDATQLRKYVVLSTGENLTETEAEAFIELYSGLSTDELNEWAIVERNGKFAGVFNAHKIVLKPQELSFRFPYEGLKLKLNGEETTVNFDSEGEYTFAGLVPGQYEAEFAFDNDQVVFEHPFELKVHYQDDSSYTASIDEYLPVGSAVFSVEVDGYAPEHQAKVVIGEQEYPVNDNGQTESIGPFLFDATDGMTAVAHVEFPWGTASSEAVAIESEYINIAVSQIDEDIQEQLLQQYMQFIEEYLDASATRDESVYTFLTPGQVKKDGDMFGDWKSRDYFFRGSFTKANFDGESIGFWPEGISIVAEVIVEGENYYDNSKSELETRKFESTVNFSYDKESEKWIVKEYRVNTGYGRPFTLEPISSIDGSQKLYESNGTNTSVESAEETAEEQQVSAEDPTPSVEEFMNHYNTLSSNATQDGDFSLVSHLITQNGPKRKEASDYIASLESRGISTEHVGTSVSKVEEVDDTRVKVTTTETFIIHGAEKTSEVTYSTVSILVKDGASWLLDELVSTKEK